MGRNGCWRGPMLLALAMTLLSLSPQVEAANARQFVLENLGWKIARVWSTDWWRDAEGEVDKLVARLRDSEVQAP